MRLSSFSRLGLIVGLCVTANASGANADVVTSVSTDGIISCIKPSTTSGVQISSPTNLAVRPTPSSVVIKKMIPSVILPTTLSNQLLAKNYTNAGKFICDGLSGSFANYMQNNNLVLASNITKNVQINASICVNRTTVHNYSCNLLSGSTTPPPTENRQRAGANCVLKCTRHIMTAGYYSRTLQRYISSHKICIEKKEICG